MGLETLYEFIAAEKRGMVLYSRDPHFLVLGSTENPKFRIDIQEKQLFVPVQWFDEGGLTTKEMEWKIYHELTSYLFLKEDYKYLAHRKDRIMEKARDFNSWMARDLFPGKDLNNANVFDYVLTEVRRFYHHLDRIAQGVHLAQRLPIYREAESAEAIYQVLVHEGVTDKLDKRSPHIQYLYNMEIEALTGYPPKDFGNYELIHRKILGKDTIDFLKDVCLYPQGVRDDLFDGYFYPVYLELWIEELEARYKEAEKKFQDVKEEQRLMKVMEDMDEEEETIDAIDLQDQDQLANEELDSPDNDDQTAQERKDNRIEHEIQEMDKHWFIEGRTRAEYEQIKKEINPLRNQMQTFWKQMLRNSLQFKKVFKRPLKKGSLIIDEFVRGYPDYQESMRKGSLNDLEIYGQYQTRVKSMIGVDGIEVTLMIDNSGSMDDIKRHYAKRAMSAMLFSLQDLNAYLVRYRKLLGKRTDIKTQVYYFGSDFEEIRPLSRPQSFQKEEKQWLDLIGYLNGLSGHTHDEKPLRDVYENLNKEQKDILAKNKLLKIIFVITDGASNDKEKVKEVLAKLRKEKIVVLGVQIGQLTEEELKQFKYIWQEPGTSQGIILGQNLSKLPQLLLGQLGDLLNLIK